MYLKPQPTLSSFTQVASPLVTELRIYEKQPIFPACVGSRPAAGAEVGGAARRSPSGAAAGGAASACGTPMTTSSRRRRRRRRRTRTARSTRESRCASLCADCQGGPDLGAEGST